jgi:hypothetical protein
MILPGLFKPTLVQSLADDGLGLALERGLKLMARQDHALLKILGKELPGGYFVGTASGPSLLAARHARAPWTGRPLLAGEARRLSPTEPVRAIFGATSTDLRENGPGLLEILRETAAANAVGDAVASAVGLSLDRFGALASTFSDLAVQYSVEDDDDEDVAPKTLSSVRRDHRASAVGKSPLARARDPRSDVEGLRELLTRARRLVRAEPSPSIYRAARAFRGVLVILNATAARRGTIVADRVNEFGSVLLVEPGQRLAGQDIHAIVPLSKADARVLAEGLGIAYGRRARVASQGLSSGR